MQRYKIEQETTNELEYVDLTITNENWNPKYLHLNFEIYWKATQTNQIPQLIKSQTT